MNGPAAPKDPEKKRDFFYIMKDKEIYGSRENDYGIQYLYQSDRRLSNSAQIVGNIEDEEMLEMLDTVEGFRKLVHSIGVSLELEDKNEVAKFIFQMYGKKDIYGGGANIELAVKGNGSEERAYMTDIDWQEDDHVPGQIKLIMDEPDKLGSLTVRLYLNDGYKAPEQEEETTVDAESEEYQSMIKKSLLAKGDGNRLADKLRRAKNGEDITVAYIGGSITQGAGATPINTECYAYKSFYKIKNMLGAGDNLHFVKAGVGGTPSELGMLRFDRDVIRGKANPDIVIIEFAVNDEGDETKGNCYESLVRKVMCLPSAPAVILLFSVFADDFNLQERLSPVGVNYRLPMVSIKDAVVPQFYNKANRILTKNQFFYDIYHPSNLGHTIMADCLLNLASEVLEKPMDIEPVIGASFDEVKLMDKVDLYEKASVAEGAFIYTDTVLQSVEMDESLELTPEFPNNWMYDGSKNKGESFKLTITCKSLVLIMKDSGEVDSARAKAFVDGEFVRDADPFVNGWLHCNPLILFDEKEAKKHEIEIKVNEEDEDKKFTILGFGYVE